MAREKIFQPSSTSKQKSVTAVTVAWSLERSIQSGFDHLFTMQEQRLITHFATAARNSLPLFKENSRCPVPDFNGFLFATLALLPLSFQSNILERALGAYIDEHLLLRKLMIRQTIERAIGDGATQIVFLGGGFDQRPFHTARLNRDVRVCVIDQDPTLAHIIEALETIPSDIEGLGIFATRHDSETNSTRIGENLIYVNANLQFESLNAVLTKVNFASKEKTLFVLEGLTYYLGKISNRNILDSIRRYMLSNTGSRAVITYMEQIRSSVVNEMCTQSSGEIFQCAIKPEEVISFVGESGLGVSEQCRPLEIIAKNHNLQISPKPQPRESRENFYVLEKLNPEHAISIDLVPHTVLDLTSRFLPAHEMGPASSSNSRPG
jgi:O-methyltransferase involved in polyketide biosynthesis